MIDKELFKLIGGNKKYIFIAVLLQAIGLIANVTITGSVCYAVYLLTQNAEWIQFIYPLIGAVIGILPSSLDVLHIQDYWNEFTQLEDFLTNYYSFDFGVGYSLFAESYYNFRWFGLVVLFLEGLLFGKLFNLDSACIGSWKKYVPIALFSMLITIPRRDIVFLSNYIALCVIAPYILIVLYATIKNSVLLNAARAKKK